MTKKLKMVSYTSMALNTLVDSFCHNQKCGN